MQSIDTTTQPPAIATTSPPAATTAIFGEANVGITEFLVPAPKGEADPGSEATLTFTRIPCTVKHRYSDFIVNEIDEAGQLVVFKSEQGDLKKWRKSNLKETLPEDIRA